LPGFWARLLALSTAWRGGRYCQNSQSSDLGGSSSRPSREAVSIMGTSFLRQFVAPSERVSSPAISRSHAQQPATNFI